MSKKNTSTIGPGHDGAPKPGFYSDAPGPTNHHPGLSDKSVDLKPHHLGVAPKIKRAFTEATPHHGANTSRQIAGANAGGMGHGVTLIDGGQVIGTSAAAAPLADAYGGQVPKVRAAAPVSPGMKRQQGNVARSLTDATPHDILGRMLLDQGRVK